MIVAIYKRNSDEFETLEAELQCGVDFCDTCGDCLACYSGDGCLNDGGHVWILYEGIDDDRIAEVRKEAATREKKRAPDSQTESPRWMFL